MSHNNAFTRSERLKRRRTALVAMIVTVAVLGSAGAAFAFWTTTASGSGAAKADTVGTGNQPTLGGINGQDITINWTPSTTVGGAAVGGYTIKRYSAPSGGSTTAATGGCSGTVTALTCTEQNVTAGTWYYSVTPVLQNWIGTEGPRSATGIVVAAPVLSFTAGQFTGPSGGTLTGGTLTHFKNNETVVFHLDTSGGTTLTGSVTQVDGTGQAGSPTPFTVTIPGTAAAGSRTVVAVGGSGSQATSNTFTVDKTTPITASVTTPTTGSSFRTATMPANFSGSAADNSGGAGLNANSTTFTLKRSTDNNFWNGTTWQATTFALATTHTATTSNNATTWTSSATLPNWANTPDGTYTVQATATDKVGNTATGTVNTFTLDNTAPTMTSMTMQDTNANGKIDHVVVNFNETLAACTAPCTTGWTLSAAPSGATLSTVTISGTQATLNLTEGGSAADTSVGSFTVALANTSGITDAVGNHSSFAATAPGDGAGPVLVSITNGPGTTTGRMQTGDSLTLVFSEPLKVASVPTTVTVTEQRSGGSTFTMPNLTLSSAIDSSYLGANNSSGTATGTVTLTNGNKSVTVTIGAVTTTGSGVATGTQPVSIKPDAGLQDLVGNGAPNTAASVALLF